MPRPKVRPEDRQRSSRACNSCKASKIRCDSQLPCSACLRRKRASSCTYRDIDRRRRTNASRRADDHDGHIPQSARDIQPAYQQMTPVTRVHASNISPVSAVTSFSPTPTDDEPTQLPQMPRRGQQTANKGSYSPLLEIWFELTLMQASTGETPALSFLYFLRKTLRPFVGPTSFTDDEHDVVAQQTESDQDTCPAPTHSAEELYALLDSYFEATSGLVDLFSADEVDTLVTARTTETAAHSHPPAAEDLAALDVALAIGAQALPKNDSHLRTANAFVLRSRQLAFEGMLANPSLSMVRLFLLLAFYMLGACQRNAASMYIGISARAAVLLGLHHGDTRATSIKLFEIRSRTWNSLRVLEVLTSFILGRTPGVPDVWLDSSHPRSCISLPATNQSAFTSMIEGAQLIENIVQQLRSRHVLHVPTAEVSLENLREWTRSLPATARVFRVAGNTEMDSAERQALVGNTHVSCVYYFSVMLITRPFLVAYLLSRLRGRAPDHLIENPDEATDMTIKNNIVSKLAQVCVSSATYMADMCRKAQQFGFSFGNLCLMNAWLFGSGLILGFSMFAGEPRKDIEDAFGAILSILSEMAETSPQAKSYHDILVDFSAAVTKYRHRVAGEVRRAVKHYMEQVLVIEPIRRTEQRLPYSQSTQTAATTWVTDLSSQDIENYVVGDSDSVEVAEVSPQWDELDFQFDSPNLVQELEELEKLFYSVE
ncbi:putative Zn(2)-C6 fungal-type domain-containing protein [Seiridium cardinale]|uniref:Zn(2)-C6 fungal-type domain-containing protein n=1 Tax=Seiridium cardinale TaxID=138064 RepID=A0ABR2XD03_9PEZI